MTSPLIHMSNYQTHPVYSAFPRTVRHVGELPIELVAVRQPAFEADAPADSTLTLGFARPHRTHDLEVEYGDGRKTMTCHAGRSAAYVNPTTHKVYMRQGANLNLLFLVCPYTQVDDFLGLLPGTVERAIEPLHARLHHTTFEDRLARAIWSAAASADPVDTLFVEQAFMTIVQSVMRAARGAEDGGTEADVAFDGGDPFTDLIGAKESRIARAIDYAEVHLDGSLSIADMAAAACLSQAQFARVFKTITGEAVWAWVQRRRLERAAGLLSETTLPLIEVAFACGYCSASHFSNAFRAKYGITPSRYRTAQA